jgi:uncharacterized membrane protein
MDINSLFFTALISMVPVAELRGAIPFALVRGVHPVAAYAVAVLANILVVPVAYFFLTTINKHLLAFPLYARLFHRIVERARSKTAHRVQRWGPFGLALFVAIPLPVTGAYTGTLAAWLFGLDRKKAFASIALGVLTAGVIVTVAVLTGTEALHYFFKQV